MVEVAPPFAVVVEVVPPFAVVVEVDTAFEVLAEAPVPAVAEAVAVVVTEKTS